jgi:mersacidin/lichenicidin family type 2 lantibiotic
VSRIHLIGDATRRAHHPSRRIGTTPNRARGQRARHRSSVAINQRIREHIVGHQQTIRAWKDLDFRAALDSDEGANLPSSPVGTIELDDADLGDASGRSMSIITQTSICATSLPCAATIAIAVSNQISCGACDESLWHGSCGFSSIGCC